ncbi:MULTISPECIES: TraR/DksA family transcriptional regulator [unclassified Streptomyces]|uniref:TraR/DksA family transcriptional regulator n=1 Tax=unclassified Streptomyces TaxID=2593676 RepID=UPI0006B0695A|nr:MULTISPECIES: TraR/DksA C4-type zinc finger protein [unclassified Streptomyces]KOX36758.1 DNA-binding protein [Streptomyces sp. NRRL F-6491]KOX51893.1 DNA-binding protein [Streptomyces sp. NRRL F-6492]
MVAKKTAAKKTTAGKRTPVAGHPTGAEEPEAAPEAAAGEKESGKRRTGRAGAEKAVVKKVAGAEKAVAKKAAAARKAVVEKTGAAAPAVPDAPAEKAGAKRTAAGKAPARKQTGARTVAAKKTAGGVTTVEDEAEASPARAGELAVRPGEEPWTPEEVAEARNGLQAEVLRLRSELAHSQEELTGLMRDSGDGAGDDQADTGTKNITREHELALAANAREMLEQSEHALERLDAGTYGLCEVCGRPIGKARMQAFPRATLCVEDKQRQERRG